MGTTAPSSSSFARASVVDLIWLVDEHDAYVNDEAWIKELGRERSSERRHGEL